jgi:hypothetical protein
VSIAGLENIKAQCASTVGIAERQKSRLSMEAEKGLSLAALGGVIHVSFLGHHRQVKQAEGYDNDSYDYSHCVLPMVLI